MPTQAPGAFPLSFCCLFCLCGLFFLSTGYKGGRFVFFNLHEIRILQYMPNKISLFLNPVLILNCDFALAHILIKLAFLPLLHLEIPS